MQYFCSCQTANCLHCLSYEVLARIFHVFFHLILLANSISIFTRLIHTSTVSKENGLMMEIADLCQASGQSEIKDRDWLRTRNNEADSFTKPGMCHTMERYLQFGSLHQDEGESVVLSAPAEDPFPQRRDLSPRHK